LIAGCIEAGKTDYVGGLAGQVSGLIKEIKPAAQLLKELVEETVEILSRKLPETVIAR
jgi:NAD(P)H-dependent flavin oxidoreductase YrpB (nitropropane dioxygenase family)